MTAAGRARDRAPLAFAAVTALFFAWGFITSNNDPLIVALRAAFHLDYTEALLTQIVFFLAYGLLSLPAAWLTARLGAVDMILGSLGVMSCGCLLVVASTGANGFEPILAALFVLAGGFTALQVAANPLAAELGSPRRSHFRLNLAQALNSLGVVIGVHFGSFVMLGRPALRAGSSMVMDSSSRAELLRAVDRAFLIMAALLVALLSCLRVPAEVHQRRRSQSSHFGSERDIRSDALALGDLRRGRHWALRRCRSLHRKYHDQFPQPAEYSGAAVRRCWGVSRQLLLGRRARRTSRWDRPPRPGFAPRACSRAAQWPRGYFA